MDEKAISRIKCAMIVYELERALGRFVRERSTHLGLSATAQEILKRTPPQDRTDQETITQVIVENSYLSEILALALSSAKGTSDFDHLFSLEKLLAALSVFDIRNAISHPNRSFPECYWFRCATISSDPLIGALGFFEVSLAFQNALEGKIEEPPENWMHKKRWSIPTALPTAFEHAITGLVGRSRDVAKLEKELKNKRAPLIALVAKGGVGKTSLMLQAMSDFCISAEASQYTDGVLWASFKQERLTSSGIEIMAAPASLQELEETLCSTASEIFGLDLTEFAAMKMQLASHRLILCLDNLETLLRDSPTEFNSFYEDLPSEWKVVVTSRIAVDSAKNIPLDVLDKTGAIALARAYLHSKGGQPADADLVDRIAAGSNNNPLAIRLTIELYLTGAEISEALQKTEKEVLSFSFANLLDQLTAQENDVLEAIFVLETPDRAELCGALSISPDEVAEAISKLSKTSLITRQEGDRGETYALGNSIRDLLRAHPRNLSIRSRTVDWLAKSRATAELAIRTQTELKTSPLDLAYLPPNVPANLISSCKQIQAAIKREDRAELVSVEASLRQQISADSSSSFMHRLYAWTVLELDDIAISIAHFQKSAALDKLDPAPLFGLALAHQKQSNKPELFATLKIIIDLGWGTVERSGRRYANRVWGLFLRAANEMDRYTEVFAATTAWEEQIDTLPSLAVNRASAYRRQADSEYRKHECDARRVAELLSKASKPLLKALISEGFSRWMLPDVRKIISELRYYSNRGIDFSKSLPEEKQAICNLLRYCLSNDAFRVGLPDVEVRDLIEMIEGKISTKQPDSPSTASPKNKARYLQDGYILAKVKNGMRPEASYLFAQDEKSTDYYVNLDVFENGSWSKKHLLRPGVELAIKFDESPTHNALRATEAWVID